MRILAISSALLLTACTGAPSTTLVLEGVMSADATCVVAPDSPLRADGIVDTTPVSSSMRPDGMRYLAFLRVSNDEPLPSSRYPRAAIALGLEARRLVVEIRRDGELVSLGASGLPNPFQVRADGLVGYASEGGAARSIVSAVVLPEAYVTALDAALGETEIELSMYVVATELDGTTERTSTTAVYPLRLCLGCLLQCGPRGTDPHSACEVGQDEPSTVACD